MTRHSLLGTCCKWLVSAETERESRSRKGVVKEVEHATGYCIKWGESLQRCVQCPGRAAETLGVIFVMVR